MCEKKWPSENKDLNVELNLENISEAKPIVKFSGVLTDKFDIYTKYSLLNKIIHIVAYCLRYFNRVVKKNHVVGPLTAIELNDADMRLIKRIQRDHFCKELVELSTKTAQVSSKSKLVRLKPFIDENF